MLASIKDVFAPEKKMGLKRNWTPAEEEYLQEAWGTTSILTIMKNLNRSRYAMVISARTDRNARLSSITS